MRGPPTRAPRRSPGPPREGSDLVGGAGLGGPRRVRNGPGCAFGIVTRARGRPPRARGRGCRPPGGRRLDGRGSQTRLSSSDESNRQRRDGPLGRELGECRELSARPRSRSSPSSDPAEGPRTVRPRRRSPASTRTGASISGARRPVRRRSRPRRWWSQRRCDHGRRAWQPGDCSPEDGPHGPDDGDRDRPGPGGRGQLGSRPHREAGWVDGVPWTESPGQSPLNRVP